MLVQSCHSAQFPEHILNWHRYIFRVYFKEFVNGKNRRFQCMRSRPFEFSACPYVFAPLKAVLHVCVYIISKDLVTLWQLTTPIRDATKPRN